MLPSLAVKLKAPLHYTSHYYLCGALPSGAFSISPPHAVSLRSLSLSALYCLFLLVSPLSLQASVSSLIQFYISHTLTFNISQCVSVPSVGPHPSPCHFLCSPQSITPPFQPTFLHLCPPSLTVIVSPFLQQITSALSDRHTAHTQAGAGYQCMGPLIILLHLLHVKHSAES